MNQPEANQSHNADAGRGLSEGLGPDAERSAFEAWISDGGKFPQAASRDARGEYRLLQAYSAWKAWQAAAAAMRERWANLASMQADIYWAAWDEHADPSDQGAATACEMLADAIRGPNA